jgi:hypothetical protein
MNLKKILELIENDRKGNDRAEALPVEGKDCLNEIEIAAYYESQIPAARRAQIEKHLSNCHKCVELLIMFSKIAAEPVDTEDVPEGDAQKLTDKIIQLINDDERRH